MNEVTIKNSGATFTPSELADFLAEKLISEISQAPTTSFTILDPACGEGELLASIARKLNSSNDKITLKGFDTNVDYLITARAILSEFKFNIDIQNKDFLNTEGASFEPLNLFTQKINDEYADLIIANPPYVRTQLLGAEKAQEIAKRFNLKGRIDLYYPFLIAMTNVLKKGGLLGVITSNRYLFTKSGESIRTFLLDNYDPIEVIDLGDTKIFDAAVLPAIFIGRKKIKKKQISTQCKFAKIYEVETRSDSEKDTVKATSIYQALNSDKSGVYSVLDKKYNYSVGFLKPTLNKTDIWQMTNAEENQWIDQMNGHAAFFIGDKFKVRVGAKSCADNVFLKQNWEENSVIPESSLFKKLISQENIQRWCSTSENGLKIIYPHYSENGKRLVIDLEAYPKAKKYFEANKEQLESRRYLMEAGRKYYEMWVPQNPQLWGFPKLVFPDISVEARFFYDENGSVVNGNCYWIVAQTEEEKELLFLIQGVANSDLMARYHDLCFNNKLYSGRRRYFSQYIEKYPIPDPNRDTSKQIVETVKKLNELSAAKQDITKLESKLNSLVNQSFGF